MRSPLGFKARVGSALFALGGGVRNIGGVFVQGGLCPGRPPSPPTAVRLCEGGTHPTGMYSCRMVILNGT